MSYLVVDVTGKVVCRRHGRSRRIAWETTDTQRGIGDTELLERLAAGVGDREGEGDGVADDCVGIFVAGHEDAVQSFESERQGRGRKFVACEL